MSLETAHLDIPEEKSLVDKSKNPLPPNSAFDVGDEVLFTHCYNNVTKQWRGKIIKSEARKRKWYHTIRVSKGSWEAEKEESDPFADIRQAPKISKKK